MAAANAAPQQACIKLSGAADVGPLAQITLLWHCCDVHGSGDRRSTPFCALLLLLLLPNRPDAATHLTADVVERLFQKEAESDLVAAALAGLLLLPEGWEAVCKPKVFVTSFVTAILQVWPWESH